MLNGNEVHIYRIKISDHENSISEFRKLLSVDETNKADRYKFSKDSISYVICRAHIKNILSDYLKAEPSSINLSYTKSGKPFINDSDIHFNLSHSGECCVIAVSHITETGVDIEKIREIEDLMNISERYFSKNEFEYLKQQSEINQTKEFFKIWTLKEAFIKAIGEGLSFPLKKFSVISENGDLPILKFYDEPIGAESSWVLNFLECDEGYTSAIAVRTYDLNIIYK